MNAGFNKQQKRKLSRLTILVGAITISLFIVGCLFTCHMLKVAEDFGESYMLSSAEQAASNIRIRIRSDYHTVAKIAARMTEEVSNFNDDNITNFLLKMVNDNPDTYQRMSFTYPDGKNLRVQSSTGVISSNPGTNKYRCFAQAMKGRACFQDGYKEPLAQSGMINRYYVPVYNKSHKIVGVMGVMFDTNMFADILNLANANNKAFTHVIDSDGNYIVKSKHEKNFAMNYFEQVQKFIKTTPDSVLDYIRKNPKGTFWYKGIGNRTYLLAYADVTDDIHIVSDIAKDTIMLNFNKLLFAIFAILLTICGLIFIQLRHTEKVYQKSERELYKLAFIDDVTESCNKSKFVYDAKQILKDHPDDYFAILSMDITKFKVINELYGFNRSNAILKDVCKIVQEELPEFSLCARDFAATFLILYKYSEEGELEEFISRVNKALSKYNEEVMSNLVSNSNTNATTKLSLCFGIYVVRDKTLSINIMCDRASIAKRNVKGDVVNTYRYYDDGLRSKILQDKAVEDEMHIALKERQYKMFLQPKFDLKTLELCGAEALVRWIHPTKGLIPPLKFIPVFESNGFIVEVDKCIWRQACEFLAKRKHNNLKLFPISVNVSRLHLNSDAFITDLCNLVKEYDIEPQYLELEVTESACFGNIGRYSEIINKLKSCGFRIAMDDFGVGYSSLNMLRILPVDILKLDRGFITDVFESDNTRGVVVVKNILKMAEELEIQTVAEGVETQTQSDFLRDNGCMIVQGFLYGKPVNTEEFVASFVKDDQNQVVS